MAELAYCVPLGIPHSEFLSWPDVDQDKAIDFVQYQRGACPGCGTRREEWEADRFAYVAESERCPGCEVIAQEQDSVPDDADTRGVRWFLKRRRKGRA